MLESAGYIKFKYQWKKFTISKAKICTRKLKYPWMWENATLVVLKYWNVLHSETVHFMSIQIIKKFKTWIIVFLSLFKKSIKPEHTCAHFGRKNSFLESILVCKPTVNIYVKTIHFIHATKNYHVIVRNVSSTLFQFSVHAVHVFLSCM